MRSSTTPAVESLIPIVVTASTLGVPVVRFQLIPHGLIEFPGAIDPEIQKLDLELEIENELIGFTLRGIGDDDDVTFEVVTPRLVEIGVIHAAQVRRCSVRCHDGTTGQPCVTCEKNGRRVKVCC